jgi:hypothetical protein
MSIKLIRKASLFSTYINCKTDIKNHFIFFQALNYNPPIGMFSSIHFDFGCDVITFQKVWKEIKKYYFNMSISFIPHSSQ